MGSNDHVGDSRQGISQLTALSTYNPSRLAPPTLFNQTQSAIQFFEPPACALALAFGIQGEGFSFS